MLGTENENEKEKEWEMGKGIDAEDKATANERSERRREVGSRRSS